jgi:hypothetical protein
MTAIVIPKILLQIVSIDSATSFLISKSGKMMELLKKYIWEAISMKSMLTSTLKSKSQSMTRMNNSTTKHARMFFANF